MTLPGGPHFLPGGAPAHPLLRGCDWSRSPLGEPAGWPGALRAAVSLVLDSAAPTWLAWGPALGTVYNAPCAQLLGDRHPQALGAPLEAVWADILPDAPPLVAAALTGQAAHSQDLRMVAPRGGRDDTQEPAWFCLSFTPLRDDAGAVRGVLCTGCETTGQVRTQQRLAASEQRLKSLALSNACALFRMSADWEQLLELGGHGMAPDAAVPMAGWLAQYVHPDDHGAVRDAIAHARRTQCALQLEHRLLRADGSVGWASSRATPVFGAGGTLAEWIGTITDLTDRRTTELALQESERRYQTLFDRIDEGFCIIEFLDGPHGPLSDYVHVAANRAYRAHTGIADVVGQRVRALAPADADADAWVDIYRRVLLTGEPVRFERTLARTGRHLELAAFRVEPAERRQVAVLFQDISQRRQAETALRELNTALEQRVAEEVAARLQTEQALRQAQKMEAVGQLTGGIAHDFNNMLAVVLGSLELLDRRFAHADPCAQRYVHAAREGARRAAQLTQRLLAFSRRQPLRPEPLDANQLLAGMSDMLRHVLGAAIRLETVQADGLWRIHADRNQLEGVIVNLALNSRDAMGTASVMEGGGRLAIETANVHLDACQAAGHPGAAPGPHVLIAVSDNGSGMTPDVIAQAFEPFFTTKPVGRGSGLGLSQVYGFIQQSGGHVRIESVPGRGTTVRMYLPRLADVPQQPACPEAAAPLPPAAPPAGRGEVVLVVDDEPGVRQCSVDALDELGYRVLQADGAAAALRLIDAHPEIALLFTDVVMPEVNGCVLAEEARRRRPGLKVLFATGYARNAMEHGALDAGVDLLGKPFSLNELARRVRHALDSRPARRTPVAASTSA